MERATGGVIVGGERVHGQLWRAQMSVQLHKLDSTDMCLRTSSPPKAKTCASHLNSVVGIKRNCETSKSSFIKYVKTAELKWTYFYIILMLSCWEEETKWRFRYSSQRSPSGSNNRTELVSFSFALMMKVPYRKMQERHLCLWRKTRCHTLLHKSLNEHATSCASWLL